ncbi:hypothetical protein ACFW1F_03815 [Streptomyces bungoensis]|uniref:hypothetical protein n=1 Tax=Streptomyces bungoensis TaxID=285568 RepID=UPI00367A76B7
MRHPRTLVNRFALGATGLALLAAGGLCVVTGTAPARRQPSWWPGVPDGVLLDPDRLDRLRGEGWWLPAAVALTAVFTCWFPARFRSGPGRPLPLAAPGATLRAGALAEALTRRAAAVPGVARGRARIVARSRRRLEVRLRVWLAPGTAPDEVLPALCAVAAEAEESAAPYTVHTRLRLSATSHRTPHVR